MSKEIIVHLDVNTDTGKSIFSFDDLGVSESEFNAMTEKEQTKLIQTVVDHEPEQPYFVVNSFKIS